MDCPLFVLWKWKSAVYRTVFTAEHVNLAAWMLHKQGVPLSKILCVTDDPTGVVVRTHPLWKDHRNVQNISSPQLPSCYRRLKIFDSATQEAMGILPGDRVVSLDIDVVILQNFLTLFDRKETYVGWKVPGTKHKIVFNGSMFLFTAGEYDWLWTTFNADTSPKAAAESGFMGSDQGYLSHQLIYSPNIGGWTAQKDGVLAYHRDVVRQRLLPKNGRVVFFPGPRKPWLPETQRYSTWIKRYLPQPGELPDWIRRMNASPVKEVGSHAQLV